MSYQKDLFRVINYPHADVPSNFSPKIPDGGPDSFGLSFHHRIAVSSGGGFLFRPHLLNPIRGPTGTNCSNAGLGFNYHIPAADPNEMTVYVPFKAWRVVSYGFRIIPTDLGQNLNGEWIARRSTTPDTSKLPHTFVFKERKIQTIMPPVGGSGNDIDDDDPSFVSGTMRDLSSFYFQLNDTSDGGHDFVEIPDSLVLINTNGWTGVGTDITIPETGPNADEFFYPSLFDAGFDSIQMRLDDIGTFLIDCKMHIEILPEPFHFLERLCFSNRSFLRDYEKWKARICSKRIKCCRKVS